MANKRTTRQTGTGKLPAAASCLPAVDANAAEVQLPADCRLAAQLALKAQLQAVLHHGEIMLDAGRVERIDTAALQLLVLFRRELEGQGGKLRWRGVNPVMSEAASLLGLEQLLNLPAATLA
ncbi:MAG: STAS domain-containing protein [Rhodanobacter sp.]